MTPDLFHWTGGADDESPGQDYNTFPRVEDKLCLLSPINEDFLSDLSPVGSPSRYEHEVRHIQRGLSASFKTNYPQQFQAEWNELPTDWAQSLAGAESSKMNRSPLTPLQSPPVQQDTLSHVDVQKTRGVPSPLMLLAVDCPPSLGHACDNSHDAFDELSSEASLHSIGPEHSERQIKQTLNKTKTPKEPGIPSFAEAKHLLIDSTFFSTDAPAMLREDPLPFSASAESSNPFLECQEIAHASASTLYPNIEHGLPERNDPMKRIRSNQKTESSRGEVKKECHFTHKSARSDNATNKEHVKAKSSKSRKNNRSKLVKPSRFCHICTRITKKLNVVVCSNIETGTCRKVICEKCLTENGFDFSEASEGPEWICTHCRFICPTRAQCSTYNRINGERRHRERTVKLGDTSSSSMNIH